MSIDTSKQKRILKDLLYSLKKEFQDTLNFADQFQIELKIRNVQGWLDSINNAEKVSANDFKSELKALLDKYNAYIQCDIDGDTHGVTETMRVYVNDKAVISLKYVNSLSASDI